MSSREPLGKKIVRLGIATEAQIDEALKLQQSRSSEQGEHIPLGALLVEMGKLAPAQLVKLLDDSGLTGFRLQEDAVRLAAQFHRRMSEADRLILFTSPTVAEDSSTVCVQLSLAMALMGQGPILMIDANLRQPSFHTMFKMENAPGLADVVDGGITLEKAIRKSGLKGLDLLTSGDASGDILSRLLSQSCDDLLKHARERYRFTLINSAPVLEYPEAALFGARTDGAVVTVRARQQRGKQVAEVARVLRGLNVTMHGTVLTTTSKVKSSA